MEFSNKQEELLSIRKYDEFLGTLTGIGNAADGRLNIHQRMKVGYANFAFGNDDEAEDWFLSIVHQDDSGYASYYLGDICNRSGRFEEAIEYFKIADNKKVIPAAFRIGLIYYNGRLSRPSDVDLEGFFLRSHSLGHITSKVQLGRERRRNGDIGMMVFLLFYILPGLILGLKAYFQGESEWRVKY